jgi:Leucine-rich repeat (LRR) protein
MQFVQFVRTEFQNLVGTGRIKFNTNIDPKNSSDEEIEFAITFIDCSFHEITGSIPDLPNCIELICKSCKLKHIYGTYPQLEKLICSDNNIIGLTNLPKCVYLDCHNNKLGSLPELDNCEFINCENNEIIAVAKKYDYCEIFICNNNKLTSLPKKLPNCIRLECYNNRLGSSLLPQVQQGCVVLHEYKKSTYTISNDQNPTTSDNN